MRKLTLFYKNFKRSLHALGCLLVLVMGAASAQAHDIPGKVTLLIFIKPQGEQLDVLVRVPMDALKEIDFPKTGPGYLDFANADSALAAAANNYIANALSLYAAGDLLAPPEVKAARVALPADRSFVAWNSAFAILQSNALPDSTELIWSQGLLDVWLRYTNSSASSQLALESQLNRLGEETNTVLHFVAEAGEERLFSYWGDPGRVEVDPGFFTAAWQFIKLGIEHILTGYDHLLFLFCLIIPLRRLRTLIAVVTAFTLAHTITLIAAVLGMTPSALWFTPLIEALIAASIVYMAVENIFGGNFKNRWWVTFAFGLVHGFGFSFILADRLQFAGDHLVGALLAFNIGVEIGQVMVLLVTVPLLNWLFRKVSKPQLVVIVMSALIVHEAWHWLVERVGALLAYEFVAPSFDMLLLAAAMRWGMLAIVIALVFWGLGWLRSRWQLVD